MPPLVRHRYLEPLKALYGLLRGFLGYFMVCSVSPQPRWRDGRERTLRMRRDWRCLMTGKRNLRGGSVRDIGLRAILHDTLPAFIIVAQTEGPVRPRPSPDGLGSDDRAFEPNH